MDSALLHGITTGRHERETVRQPFIEKVQRESATKNRAAPPLHQWGVPPGSRLHSFVWGGWSGFGKRWGFDEIPACPLSCLAGTRPYTNPIIIPGQYPSIRGVNHMGKAIECIYENNVLKPVGTVQLKEGERIRVTIEKKLPFEPIQLKKKPASERISALRDESWTSS